MCVSLTSLSVTACSLPVSSSFVQTFHFHSTAAPLGCRRYPRRLGRWICSGGQEEDDPTPPVPRPRRQSAAGSHSHKVRGLQRRRQVAPGLCQVGTHVILERPGKVQGPFRKCDFGEGFWLLHLTPAVSDTGVFDIVRAQRCDHFFYRAIRRCFCYQQNGSYVAIYKEVRWFLRNCTVKV